MRLWDAGTETLIASGGVTPVAGEWREVVITPVVLASGSEYVVTHYADSGGARQVGRAPSSITFHPAVTSLGGRFVNSTAFPSTSTSNHYYSADIMFSL